MLLKDVKLCFRAYNENKWCFVRHVKKMAMKVGLNYVVQFATNNKIRLMVFSEKRIVLPRTNENYHLGFFLL